jgi:hypothetical protein
MDTRQLEDALAKLFVDFMNRLPFLTFGDTTVHIIRLDQVGGLEAKLRLEHDDPNGKFLLYAPTEEPAYEDDWLLDIRLYSRSFRADRASILLDELGLVQHHLRDHLAARRTFFDHKDRLRKLKALVTPTDSAAREAVKVGFDYFKANASHVSASAKPGEHDMHLHVVELHNTSPTTELPLAAYVALCSAILGKPVQSQLVVLGSMSLGGTMSPVKNLAESLQVAFDAGAKRLLLPMASVNDIPTIPGELFAKFQTSFYADPRDAVFKALGVE